MSGSPASLGAQRGLRSDQISGVVLVLIALLVAWENRVFPLGSLAAPGPGYMPLLLAIALGAFGLLVALRGGASPLLNTIDWTEGRRAIALLIACGVAVFVIERIGYRLTTIALLLFLLGVLERKRPLPAVLVALGFAFISYFIFATLLKVQLPRGPWGL
ncbi:MAG: tripartite tricarboxylate transporter TctB family protein [Betaproteobacteria bacterium]|nr:tripartite tricarboxylate transporter TctB family protein [Betaproteobacteria bacterium]